MQRAAQEPTALKPAVPLEGLPCVEKKFETPSKLQIRCLISTFMWTLHFLQELLQRRRLLLISVRFLCRQSLQTSLQATFPNTWRGTSAIVLSVQEPTESADVRSMHWYSHYIHTVFNAIYSCIMDDQATGLRRAGGHLLEGHF